jgi:iron complex outermembrane receptor protein/hemoglobin/transferrin/lactoferrin receptor protein
VEGILAIAGLLTWAAGPGEAPPRAYEGPLEPGVEAREPARPEEAEAAERPAPAAEAETPAPDSGPEAEEAEAPGMQRTVVVDSPLVPKSEPDRASTVVTRRELEERLPRSAPDALRYEPGVYVQQTAHSQASPYVRGLTGQQTLLMFDGIRLNNSTFRQGPNQYFFTVDSRTIHTLEVIRGSASTRYGSDALGGALITQPIEPSLDVGKKKLVTHGRGMMRAGTADREIGGRAQLDLSYKGKLGVFGGVGYRDVGQLKSGGKIIEPQTGDPQGIPPRFEDDNKTQKGTGFRELTADTRLVWKQSDKLRFTLGYYDYRQLDAPRTDKCPAASWNWDACLRYLEQFRTLAYGAMDTAKGPAAAEKVRWTVSFQNQHERRHQENGPILATENNGLDDVYSVGTGLKLSTRTFRLAEWSDLQVLYGTDAYHDWIASEAWKYWSDTKAIEFDHRGQYLDGSRYLTSGLWTEVHSTLRTSGQESPWKDGKKWRPVIRLRAGGRGALVHAHATGEQDSETVGVNRVWGTGVGSGGVALQALPWLGFMVNADQGFRAPNLDDLTARQQVGPGFQFENADLEPERSTTLEGGARITHPWVEFDGWVFQNWIHDKMDREDLPPDQCPESEPACGGAQWTTKLTNLDGVAVIRGAEAGTRVFLPLDFFVRATIAYAWGEGDHPHLEGDRMPLSRIPPLNGTAEAGWRSSKLGLYGVAALRWAAAQDRLSVGDVKDVRIPDGGTPGFAVVDLRAGYRWDPHLLVGLVFENVGDAPYRYHGSSINGPGRGLIVNVEMGW